MGQIVDERPKATIESRRGGDSIQVVMLGIGDEVFALGTGMVREIIDPVHATRVAGARPYLPCVINARGNVIPLANLRTRFGMPHI